MADFLLELLSEEIPARMQAKASADLDTVQGVHHVEIESHIVKSNQSDFDRHGFAVNDGSQRCADADLLVLAGNKLH